MKFTRAKNLISFFKSILRSFFNIQSFLIFFALIVIAYIFRDSDFLHGLTNSIRWVLKSHQNLFLVLIFSLIIFLFFLICYLDKDLVSLKNRLRALMADSPKVVPITQVANENLEKRLQKLEANIPEILDFIKKNKSESKLFNHSPKDSFPSSIDLNDEKIPSKTIACMFADSSSINDFTGESFGFMPSASSDPTLEVTKTIINLTIDNFPDNKDFFRNNSNYTPYSNLLLDNSVDSNGVPLLQLSRSNYFNAEFLLLTFKSCDFIIPNPCCTRFNTLLSTFKSSSPVYEFVDSSTEHFHKLISLCKVASCEKNNWSILEKGTIGINNNL
jgi:hypothetical protein